MSFCRHIGLYLSTYKVFGILHVTYRQKNNTLLATSTNQLCAAIGFCATQLMCGALFAATVVTPSKFYPPIHNKTGQIYLLVTFCLSVAILSLINMYFYFKRTEHLRLVQALLKFDRKTLKSCKRNHFFQLYILYIVLVVLSWYNHLNGFSYSLMSGYGLIVTSSVFSVAFMVCGIFIGFYICIEGILEGGFESVNVQLMHVLAHGLYTELARRNFKNLLIQRNDLLLLCHEKINHIYGIMLLPITAYMLFSAPSGIFYLISVVVNYNSYDSFIHWLNAVFVSVTWNLPLTLLFIILMSTNGVAVEVEKYLLKNLRPKPILTAYGFFTLDKSTLFALFATGMTYMIILVQFKQMETSNDGKN